MRLASNLRLWCLHRIQRHFGVDKRGRFVAGDAFGGRAKISNDILENLRQNRSSRSQPFLMQGPPATGTVSKMKNSAREEMKKFTYDKPRFKELILYVSQQCADAPKFGATKLNKILYFADFLAYAELGEPITGAVYFSLPAGPAPKALKPVREEMKASGELAVQSVPFGDGRRIHKTRNLREPDLNVFTPGQIAIVDRVIAKLWNEDADGCSALSHRMVGWQTTADRDTIPYESIFFSNAPLTEEQERRGSQVAERYVRELASAKN